MSHIIKEIWIYPIKSLGGIQLESAMAYTEGLQYDRRWMLVDDQGLFITQRNHPELAKYRCQIQGEHIVVYHNNDSVSIPIEGQSDNTLKVKVWDSYLRANEVHPQISAWFSDHISMKATLVKMTNISLRPKQLLVEPFETKLSFADGYPYLILGDQSLSELNEKLASPISASRFRANIIVTTDVGHEEDHWGDINIGDAQMKVIKPCARCVVINIDPKTALIAKEPNRTLANYRLIDNKIYFGANAICRKEGIIKVGDHIS